MIPTSGGVSAVSYSTQSNPYGLPYISKVLGRSIICTGFATASGTVVQVSGLSVTVNIPTGRKVRITFWTGATYNDTVGKQSISSIWDGAVSSGTQLATATAGQGGSATAYPTILDVIATPDSASKTYNAGYYANGGGTATVSAAATSPATLTVELV